MLTTQRHTFLRAVLLADAATCVATGTLMTAGASFVAGITHIPSGLLTAAGLALFPIAVFIAFVATRPATWPSGVWLVILGNAGWVVGCLAVPFTGAAEANTFGIVFALAQALAVAVLAELEFVGLRRLPEAS